MSLSSALGSALSGLAANARRTDVIAGNLANALTPGYAPRALGAEARLDGGVRVSGIARQLDPVILGDRRLADSASAGAAARADFAASLARALPSADVPGSLTERLSRFEAALVTATARPEDDLRLDAVLREADGLARALNAASAEIDILRSRADAQIAQAVEHVNGGLARVEELNARIVTARSTGQDTATLEDLRQSEIDALAEYMPLRQLDRSGGAVALVTTGGALLLDGRAAEIAFEPTRIVTARMSLSDGQLSGLRIDGREVPATDAGPLGGGRLGALFDNRDRLGPEAGAALDEVARVLIERVEALTPPPIPGLFTDAGARLDPTETTGLAGRIALTPAVDPERGGALFRLRDGLEAGAPGGPADAPYLNALIASLAGPGSVSGAVSALEGAVAQTRLAAEDAVSFAFTRAGALRLIELEGGVDSDAELQRLLLVEQAFAANARMIQTIDDMMQTLLRI
ncbi:MAG: flagellar hook-associated protein FlgK [Roseovarius sp.]|nr:flagellar hook-associated protein FlgK [Roseovarius sp.]